MLNRKIGVSSFALLVLLALLAACGAQNSAVNNPGVNTPASVAAAPTQAAIPTTAPAPVQATNAAGAATAQATETESGFEPPNCGGSNCEQPGPANTQNLQGDVTRGQQVFQQSCTPCHGQLGKGGTANPGSDDGVVPPLNPIDTMFNTNDPKEFALELDLFIEHGSHTKGPLQMPAWGDTGQLKPQQIADVIAYVMSLNK